MGLHPFAASNEPVALPDFWGQSWDATVIRCRQALDPGEAHQRGSAASLDVEWYKLETGHYTMLNAPDDLTELTLAGKR